MNHRSLSRTAAVALSAFLVACYEPNGDGDQAAREDAASDAPANGADARVPPSDSSAGSDTRSADDAKASGETGGTTEAGCKCGDPGCCDPSVKPSDCCGASCPVQHNSGVCGAFWSCLPKGVVGKASTYSDELAIQAAAKCSPGAPGGATATCREIKVTAGSSYEQYCFAFGGARVGYAVWTGAGGSCCGYLESASVPITSLKQWY